MSPDRSDEETAPHGCAEGFALVHRARDTGDWKPVADWLLRRPECAAALARVLEEEREVVALLSPRRPVRPGAVLGDFELGERLGGGAMGDVYRARDLRVPRAVAVKVVRACSLAPADLSGFRFEAEALAGLSHKNVVPLIAYGESGGEPYLAMPLLTGGTLDGWLKARGGGGAPAAAVAALVRDIALGVHHAHQHGLIHRDLKPANILLDSDGVPHVADFGLARRAGTIVTGGAGSPAYMAPEQARGDRHLTTAVDVWALGVILFELLAGRTPFGGGGAETVRRRVIEEPPPALRAVRRDAPQDLEVVCARCLAKAPEDRYPSAQALADDLNKFLRGDPIDGRRGWVGGAVSRALGWQRKTTAMGSWRVGFWGAASTLFAMLVMQAAVLLGAPRWVPQAAVAYYLIAWLLLMWGFLVARRDALNPVERASTALHFGAKFACAAVLPVQLWLHGGDPVYALPPFLAIVGVVVFAHGFVYWGRFYLFGLGQLLAVGLMPLVPVTYWPAVYGLLLGVLQLWAGFHLRRVHLRGDPPAP
ncbi:serine/threonine-protein kinase [Gemmata sp. JC717]|uniref:serine/threonine-protein kinase n=1 Tax=Gemmata algarum TaxID=2975278 RepID=UPI0021BAF84A|nr:serine/threonine-protein kinase [Gemmata algarum]MDY3552500.1 serine/threonine-protein kinase [Gemmata algarum]